MLVSWSFDEEEQIGNKSPSFCKLISAHFSESPKDTTADQALKFTYTNPQIKLFEQEIDEELGIKDDREKAPTFWY